MEWQIRERTLLLSEKAWISDRIKKMFKMEGVFGFIEPPFIVFRLSGSAGAENFSSFCQNSSPFRRT